MDCAAIEAALSDYHFATLSPPQLEQMHQHLIGCSDCTQRYLEFKYAVDSGAAMGVRPSARLRSRLRTQVREMFPAPPSLRARQWLARPVPRYQAAAAALFASLLFLAAGSAVLGPRLQTGPVLADRQDAPPLRYIGRHGLKLRRGYESVDTARPMAVSLTYY